MLRGGDTPSNAWSPSARRAAVVRKPPEALSTYAAILAAATMGFGLVALVCGIQMIVRTIGAGHFVWPDAGYFTWAFIEVPLLPWGCPCLFLSMDRGAELGTIGRQESGTTGFSLWPSR
jgi:hypothetical protein